MTADPAPYTLRHIQEMLGLSRSVVASLVAAGFVQPHRGARKELRFSFQDVVLLRTAHHLRAAEIPPRRLLSALKQLRERLPPELPLSGLRIKAIGNEVAVREGDAQWGAESGQLLMDFEVSAQRGAVSILAREAAPLPTPAPSPPAASAQQWFQRGEALESGDAAAAEAAEEAYRQALALAPAHLHAAVNLAALLCDAGRSADALAVIEPALALHADEPLLLFNAAIALEDLGRGAEALQRYEQCLRAAPDFLDAHHNAAKLCEALGERQRALRHYSAWRRLERAQRAAGPADA